MEKTMEKLKTLKELDCVHCPEQCDSFNCKAYTMHTSHAVSSKDLRELAIKYIKSKHCRKFVDAFDSDLMSNKYEAWGAEKLLMHIFNITEEELQ